MFIKISPLNNLYKKSVLRFYVMNTDQKKYNVKCYWKPELSKRSSLKKNKLKKKEILLKKNVESPEYVENDFKNLLK